MVKLVLKFISAILIFIITHKWTCVGQLSTRETLNTTTECSLNDVNFDCGNAKVLAMQTVVFGYSTGCDATCCEPDSSHCHELAESSEILYVRRECSGSQSCTVDLDGDRSFCSIGTRPPSYVTVSYQCIPESRIASICSTTTLTSDDGSPLYLTNPNYPAVTTGDSTCSCSLEVFDCSSIVALYIIDADLYLDTATCEQRLDFENGDGTVLKTIACESYYSASIQSDSLNGHYVKVDFTDNSVANQEGYFFLAFEASDSTKSFRLSCTAQAESWCVDCGTLPTIPDGSVALDDPSDSGYQAEATVTCNLGYETDMSKITCQENATWESADCRVKDCGSVSPISNGDVVLADPSNTTYGATASVTCDQEYNASKPEITCLSTGSWETALCKDHNEMDDDDEKEKGGANGGIDLVIVFTVVGGIIILTILVIGGIFLCKRILKRNGVVDSENGGTPVDKGHIKGRQQDATHSSLHGNAREAWHGASNGNVRSNGDVALYGDQERRVDGAAVKDIRRPVIPDISLQHMGNANTDEYVQPNALSRSTRANQLAALDVTETNTERRKKKKKSKKRKSISTEKE